MVKPAYLIPLTQESLAILGELVVILGQIEEEIVLATSGLLQADRPATDQVMGASKMSIKSGIWEAFIKLRYPQASEILGWVEYAVQELIKLSADRNDFVHANWHHIVAVSVKTESGLQHLTDVTMRMDSNREPSKSPRGLARRIQNINKERSAEELKAVRDRAATLSCVVAHIGYCIAPHGNLNGDGSPWRDKLPPKPDPRPAKAKARKGKGRDGQREP